MTDAQQFNACLAVGQAVVPHEYQPSMDAADQGDCSKCGHVKSSAVHALRVERLEGALNGIARMKLFPDDVINRLTLMAAIACARAALNEAQS